MFIDVPDARLLALSFGDGPRTLLAIGGWIGPGELWLETLGRLAGRWRCITYDHRGTGASTCGADPIRLSDLVDDLFAVLDAQGVGRCVLAAESAGAAVAMQAILREPNRFDGLVTVGGNWLRPVAGQHDALIAGLRADFARTIGAFVDRCLPEAGSGPYRHWGRQMLMRSNPEHAVQLLRCKSELTVQDRLHELRLPALLLHGSLDAVVPPPLSTRLSQALSGSRLRILEGFGHVPTVTAPELVAAEIDAFLGDAPPVAGP
jgi:pimeloyl-ACP methyl ester carboxylesterase